MADCSLACRHDSDHPAVVPRRWFTRKEAASIRSILVRLRKDERPAQKALRHELRGSYGFFITEFSSDAAGMTRSDFDGLIERGVIRLVDDENAGVPLTSMSDFDFWTSQEGVIAISDRARSERAMAHRPLSPHVDRDFFKEKVLDNAGWNGSYHWYRSRAVAQANRVAICPTCQW